MPDSSKAYSKFLKTFTRSLKLISTYRSLKNKSRKIGYPSPPVDMIRASIVLSVAALDAYITDVFSEKLVPYIKKYSPDDLLIDILKEAGLDTREALNLINMYRPYRRIRTLVERYYDRYTTQTFKMIDKLFLAYRLKNISDRAQDKSGRKTLKRSVEILVERRHEIVHDGDYNSHNNLNSINVRQMEKRINDIQLFVQCVDEIICNRI